MTCTRFHACCAGLAVPHQALALRITHGLISIAAGVAAGTALGLVCAVTPVWTSPFRRAGALLVMAELMAFCGYTPVQSSAALRCIMHCSACDVVVVTHALYAVLLGLHVLLCRALSQQQA